jgi:outer membrane protein OmpA-like peptidoglycan-associated protein
VRAGLDQKRVLFFREPRRIQSLISVTVLVLCISAKFSYASSKFNDAVDSVHYRDTLVASTVTIEHRPLRVGMYGGIGFDQVSIHDASQPLITRCDSLFDVGNGTSPYFGVQGDIPFWGDQSKWTVTPRLGFAHYAGKLTWTQLDSTRVGTLVRAHHFEHVLDVTFSAINFSSLFNYHPIGGLQLSVGPEVLVLFRSNVTRHVDVVEPGDLINGTTSHVEQSAAVPKRRLFSAGLIGSLAFEVPVSKKLRALPEVAFEVPFAGLSPNFNATSMHIGIGFQFDLTPRYEAIPTYVVRRVPIMIDSAIPKIDTTPHRPTLSASIDAFAIEKNGDSSRVLTISIQEVRSRSAYPVLNYIFFDEGSSSLPARFVKYASNEDALAFFKGAEERHDIKLLDLYKETLNILGARLLKDPKCIVTLTGCTSNTGVEANKLELARARAEEVKQYLISIWKVDPKKIKTVARLLPERPSPTAIEQGAQENRRVEIDVSDPAVLDPVMVLKTERLATPPNIRMVPKITADAAVARIHTAISGGGRELLASDTGPQGSHDRIVWRLDEEVLEQLSDSLYLSLDVRDVMGTEVHAHRGIPLSITHLTSEKKEGLSRFSLILFGFDESTVGSKNQRVLNRIVNALNEVNTTEVSVVGYTDEMGDAQHNQMLSQQRAQAAAGQISQLMTKMKLPALDRILTEGRGSREVLYDNTLPEGRFFSRTVNVTIEGSAK